jgi:hypothetical protein
MSQTLSRASRSASGPPSGLVTTLFAGGGIMVALFFAGQFVMAEMKAERVAADAPDQGAVIGLNDSIRVVMTNPQGRPETTDLDNTLIDRCFPQSNSFERHRARQRRILHKDGKQNERFKLPYQTAVHFVTCAGRIRQERFCQKFYRDRYIKWIRGTLAIRQHALAVHTVSTVGNPVAQEALRRQEEFMRMMHEAETGKRVSSGRMTLRQRLEHINPAFLETIGYLSRTGYLQVNDFGWFGRNSIPDAIRDYVVAAQSVPECRQ